MKLFRPLEPILFTRSLSKLNLQELANTDLNYGVEPQISIQLNTDWSEADALFSNIDKANVIVTSKNGAEALIQFLTQFPTHRAKGSYFAVGLKTRRHLQKAGILAYKPKIHDAEGLAQFIIEQSERKKKPAIFFHGDKALDTLPQKLSDAGIELHKVCAYLTELLKSDLRQHSFNSVVFMSPSAVEAFHLNQGFVQPINYVFSIGSTTAKAVEQYVADGITLGGNKPSFEQLISLISHYKKALEHTFNFNRI